VPVILSAYRAPWFLHNGHAHTIYPALRRRITGVRYERERLELDDGDFLDLDWSRAGGPSVVLIAHGLEGSAEGTYMKGMVRAFNRRGWDAVALNFRGCSGESNRLARFYHSGATEDLWQVTEHVARQGYRGVALVGFSLGGNVTLKLLGELGGGVPAWLLGGVAISVPCDLKASAEVMARPVNRAYMKRFLRDLHAKLRAKQKRFPKELDDSGYGKIRGFREFDDRYTAPLHGFRDAEDYWARCSARFFLAPIRRPTLLLSAADDPFLAPECFPREIAGSHEWLHLEVPAHGGHVGFAGGGLRRDEYFSERRALEFLGADGSGSSSRTPPG
jgi:uncharacterized protein